MRIALLRTGETEHRLIWSTHHLLVDGWSWPLIFSELSALYAVGAARQCWIRRAPTANTSRGFSSMTGRPTTRSGAACSAVSWIRRRFPPLPRAARVTGKRAAKSFGSLTHQASAALGALARNHQVTLGAIVGAAWSVVLAHHSGRSDVVFGRRSPAGRTASPASRPWSDRA